MEFLDKITKAQHTEGNVDKLDLTKLKPLLCKRHYEKNEKTYRLYEFSTLYPFTCQMNVFGLFPPLGCCEQHCCEPACTGFLRTPGFSSLGTDRDGMRITGSHGNSVFNLLRAARWSSTAPAPFYIPTIMAFFFSFSF